MPQHQGPGGRAQQNQSRLAGFQANPNQLHDRTAYHVFTTSSCRRDRKLQRRATMAVTAEPDWPRWLNWSEPPITWTRDDHPPSGRKPRGPGSSSLSTNWRIYTRQSTHGWRKQHQHPLLRNLSQDGVDPKTAATLQHRYSLNSPRQIGTHDMQNLPGDGFWKRREFPLRAHTL